METKYCEKHPKTETRLACSRCDKPICPRCMVETPVGMRCRECAKVSRLPTFDVTGAYLARGIAAGLVSAILAGAAFVLLSNFLFLGSFMGLVALGAVGYVVGEAISVSVNRRRGRTLKTVAAASVFLAFVTLSVGALILFGTVYASLYTFLGLGAGVYVAISRF